MMQDRGHQFRRLIIIVVGTLLLVPLTVGASRIAYQDITIERAATLADTILVATFISEQNVHGTVYRFRVLRTLVGSGATAGSEIRVRRAHYTEWTRAMRIAESTGVRRSPLINRLPSPPSVELSPSGRYCLLLDEHSIDPDALELAVAGGHLAESDCAQVVTHHRAQ